MLRRFWGWLNTPPAPDMLTVSIQPVGGKLSLVLTDKTSGQMQKICPLTRADARGIVIMTNHYASQQWPDWDLLVRKTVVPVPGL